jgi:hypothetical protein
MLHFEIDSDEQFAFLSGFTDVDHFDMDDIWLVTGFDDAEKTLTEYLTIFSTVFPDCLSFVDKWLVDRSDGVRHEHIHEDARLHSYFITYMRTRNLYFTNRIGRRPA